MRFSWYMLALLLLLLLLLLLPLVLLLLLLLYRVSHSAVRTGCCGGAELADMPDRPSLHHWNLEHGTARRNTARANGCHQNHCQLTLLSWQCTMLLVLTLPANINQIVSHILAAALQHCNSNAVASGLLSSPT